MRNASGNRRDSARHRVVPNRAVVAWTVQSRNEQIAAALTNISLSGAMLVSERFPPVKSPVWVRLESPAPTDWAEAMVVGIAKEGGIPLLKKPRYRIRLRFSPTCPYELFKAATHGESINSERQEHVSPEFDSRLWR